jgi:hypothetical protein
MPTIEYAVEGATERKYMDWPAALLPTTTNWTTPAEIDRTSVDYSWCPDPQDPAYIYEFATQWQPNGGAVYVMPGARERKYVEHQHRRLSDATNWTIPAAVDINSVDTSWHPSNTEQPSIYEFATQWQPNGGAVYTVPGARERKYVEHQHRRLPDKQAFTNLEVVQGFDYSWHPDNTEESYNDVFGNQHWPGTEMPTLVYKMPGATQEKFVEAAVARLRPILMTTLATALGALPIALALGSAGKSRIPLGVVIIGGLLFSLVLTLFVVPSLYVYIYRKKRSTHEI